MSVSVFVVALFFGSAMVMLALCWRAPLLIECDDGDIHRLDRAKRHRVSGETVRRAGPTKDARLRSIAYPTRASLASSQSETGVSKRDAG